jgi:hypothetical protein
MSSKPGFWRKCRIAFRCCRIATLLAVLALVCAVIWFNRVGLPDFLKRPLVQTLREHGVELEFSRLRLRISRGLVADNVRIGLPLTTNSPVLTSLEIQLQLNLPALLRRQLQMDGLVLHQGRFVLPVSPTNSLTLTNIQAELRFQTNDTWSLDNFNADFAGAKISLNGDIAHAPELRRWEWFRPMKPGGEPSHWQEELKKISDALDRIHFSGTPHLTLAVNGDARDMKTFDLRLNAQIPGAATPWGDLRNGTLTVQAKPQDDHTLPVLTVRLVAGQSITPWGTVRRETLVIRTAASPVTQPPPAVLHLEAADAETRWGGARGIQLDASLTAPADMPTKFDATLAWWTNAQPYQLAWMARLADWKSENISASAVACGGFWQSPELAVTNLSAKLGGGALAATALLNVATRELVFTSASDFDPHTVAALLTEKTRERLYEFSWTQPPELRANGSLVLPVWTNRQPDWRDEVQQTIRLNGELAFTNASVLGAKIDSAHTHFSYSNLVWNLPDLSIAQARTKLELNGGEEDATKKYEWHIRGAFDPESARPFLTASNAVRGFSRLKFTEPVILDADVTGRLYDYYSMAASGHLSWTNFSYRGQSADSVVGGFFYTNRVLEFLNPRLRRAGGAQTLTADAVVLDFNTRLISFTNGFSTAAPMAVVSAIGPNTAKLIEPYEFLQPPVARVNGCVPLRDVNGGHDLDDADMKFEILQGVPFRWTKLETTNILGTIHWKGQILILTNVTAKIYGGDGSGFANFDFRPKHKGADYQFAVTVTNVDLHLLAAGLTTATNRLEGVLDGVVTVTNASTENLQSWNGYGRAHLRDGMLWDVAIFGIFSPVLNAVSPGLGNSRAKEAAAKFSITNGVIATDSLEIRSMMTRLEYAGTVDLKGSLHATVTAQPLRDVWVIGPLVSPFIWPITKVFEYKVTGTLKNPKSEPVLFPTKLLMMPLHPIRSFESLLPTNDESSPGPTNAPPVK